MITKEALKRLEAYKRSAPDSILGRQVLQDYTDLVAAVQRGGGTPPPPTTPVASTAAAARRRVDRQFYELERMLREQQETNKSLRAVIKGYVSGEGVLVVAKRLAAELGVSDALTRTNSRSPEVRHARDVIRATLHEKGFTWGEVGAALGVSGGSAQTIHLRKQSPLV